MIFQNLHILTCKTIYLYKIRPKIIKYLLINILIIMFLLLLFLLLLYIYNNNYRHKYQKISIKRTDEVIEESKSLTSLSFYVVVDISDNGERKANYLFNAIALYINNKKDIDSNRDIEVVLSVKDSR